jgi:hypothetical protein
MMQAIGTGGHVSAHRLPQLAYYAPLMRLLHALPPLHRVRLLSLMVVECIKARCVLCVCVCGGGQMLLRGVPSLHRQAAGMQ